VAIELWFKRQSELNHSAQIDRLAQNCVVDIQIQIRFVQMNPRLRVASLFDSIDYGTPERK
jgi:hypothetical protein